MRNDHGEETTTISRHPDDPPIPLDNNLPVFGYDALRMATNNSKKKESFIIFLMASGWSHPKDIIISNKCRKIIFRWSPSVEARIAHVDTITERRHGSSQ